MKEMKNVKKMKRIFIFLTTLLLVVGLLPNAYANDAQEKMYLTQILNQLDAMQPLIIAAERAQPKNARIQFHYTQFRDAHGNLHHGLLEDIRAIRAGIKQKLNSVSVEPRVVSPIKGDFDDRG